MSIEAMKAARDTLKESLSLANLGWNVCHATMSGGVDATNVTALQYKMQEDSLIERISRQIADLDAALKAAQPERVSVPVSDERVRAEFEAWAVKPPMEFSIRRYPETAGSWPGNYCDYNVQCAWEAWHDRALLAAAQEGK